MATQFSPILNHILSTLKTHGNTQDARELKGVLDVLLALREKLPADEQRIAGTAIKHMLDRRAADRRNKTLLQGVIDDRSEIGSEEDT